MKSRLVNWRRGLIWALVPVLAAGAQTESQRLNAESLLWQFQLNDARKATLAWPQGIWAPYYQAQIELYRFIGSQRQKERQICLNAWENARKLLHQKAGEDPQAPVLLADLYLKRALLAFMEQDYWTAATRARDSRHWLKIAEKKQGSTPEVKKLQGLFQVLFGATPKKYQWLASALGLNGNMTYGIRLLDEAAREGAILKKESVILAAWAEKQFQNRPHAALQRLQALKHKEESHLLDFFTALVYLQVKKNNEALALLRKRDHYARNNEIHYIVFWDYLLGKALYFREAYQEAQAPLSRFIRDYEGTLFRGDAAWRLGWALTFAGDFEKGKSFFTLVAQGGGGFDEDEYARYQAATLMHGPPNAEKMALMRARNRFDGGYYPTALAHLDALQARRAHLPPHVLAELDYRYGRIYHGMNRLPEAELHYSRCLVPEAGSERWLQGYACYYLGDIRRQQHDPAGARLWFQRALTYDNIYYQSGLETRCKAALAELKPLKMP